MIFTFSMKKNDLHNGVQLPVLIISLSLAVASPPDGGRLGYVMCRGARLHECSSEKMAN